VNTLCVHCNRLYGSSTSRTNLTHHIQKRHKNLYREITGTGVESESKSDDGVEEIYDEDITTTN
jgi:hypothetical protein